MWARSENTPSGFVDVERRKNPNRDGGWMKYIILGAQVLALVLLIWLLIVGYMINHKSHKILREVRDDSDGGDVVVVVPPPDIMPFSADATVQAFAAPPTTGDTATFCVKNKPIKKSCKQSQTAPCLLVMDDIQIGGGISISNSSVLSVDVTNYYNLFVAIDAVIRCPIRTIKVSAWEITTDKKLAEVDVNGFMRSFINISVIMPAGSQVTFVVHNFVPVLDDSIILSGTLAKTGKFDKLAQVTTNDIALKVEWIPQRPVLPNPPFPNQYPTASSAYPWNSSVIPHDYITAPTLPPGVPNRNRYDKHLSIQGSVYVYLGLDPENVAPEDPRLSIFLTNYEERGSDNYRKKVYMTALTSGIVGRYSEKTDSFLNEVVSSFSTYKRPVLSSFKTSLVKYFLDLHLGYGDHPDYVVEYFTKFVDVVGFGDPTRPGRNDVFMFGIDNIERVKTYFRERNEVVKQSLDQSSIIYYWHTAGLDPEGLVMEAVHNIIAFSQFNNVLFLVINDKLSGTNRPAPFVGVDQYDFFSKYGNATDDTQRLNVVRELYRLLVPNSVSFSRVKEQVVSDPTVTIQSRHVHKTLMITASAMASGGNLTAYFAYNPGLYGSFNTNFGDTACPPPTVPYNPADGFVKSAVDGETLLDRCNTKMVPVFPIPLYSPFGLGYRRCAGEVFVYDFTMRMLERMRTLNFVFKPVPPGTPPVTLAPFSSVPDNIFVS